MDRTQALERGRDAFAGHAWSDAYAALAAATEPEDIERLATAAYMLGRDEEFATALERAHHCHLEAGATLPAARCAFWLGIGLALRGEAGRAAGWLGRARRLVERERSDCVEAGYLLLPVVIERRSAGDYDAAHAAATDAARFGERFGDDDLLALAVHEQGLARVKQGRVAEGLRLLDEAMVAVVAGELSPIVTGLLYCSVIEGCQEAYALQRAQEWTAALTKWCAQQPDMVSFTGRCLVHRAEIMELRGAWDDALDEARRAARRLASAPAAAQALYRQGELHRLRGDHLAAEAAYREASRRGGETQPGLALLRLAQGDRAAAAAAIRRATAEAAEPLSRARLLPAAVEILLAEPAAEDACRELEELARGRERGMLGALAAHARGQVELARGRPREALVALRRASRMWQDLEAPYEVARVRATLALACRGLGDEDSAALELDAARAGFERLGAATDLARLDELTRGAVSHGLTARELQVLQLVAAGATNRAIAAELVLSERTVDRHVSNILGKLRVPSRAAATAYAYEHRLV